MKRSAGSSGWLRALAGALLGTAAGWLAARAMGSLSAQRWIDSDTVTLVSCVTTDLLTITAAAFLLFWLGGLAPAYLTAAVASFAAALFLRHSGEGGVLLDFWPQLLTTPRIVVPVIGVGTAIVMLVRMLRTDESRRVRGWLYVVVLVTAVGAAALTVGVDLFLIGYARMLRGP